MSGYFATLFAAAGTGVEAVTLAVLSAFDQHARGH
jgi:hypothetical protein